MWTFDLLQDRHKQPKLVTQNDFFSCVYVCKNVYRLDIISFISSFSKCTVIVRDQTSWPRHCINFSTNEIFEIKVNISHIIFLFTWPVGPDGRAPGEESEGEPKPPWKLTRFLCLKKIIVTASAVILHELMYRVGHKKPSPILFCLKCYCICL